MPYAPRRTRRGRIYGPREVSVKTTLIAARTAQPARCGPTPNRLVLAALAAGTGLLVPALALASA
jgi:hypothetical protein